MWLSERLNDNNINIALWTKTNCNPWSFFSFQWSTSEGGLDYHWDSCVKGYNQLNKVRVPPESDIRLLADYEVDFFVFFLNKCHAFFLPLSPADCTHIHALPIPPTISFTSCPTAVWAMELRASLSCAPVRPSRCHFCSPTCWMPQLTTLMCCCSHICPAGMSLSSRIFR